MAAAAMALPRRNAVSLAQVAAHVLIKIKIALNNTTTNNPTNNRRDGRGAA
jgi:hypothetical protein